MGLSGKSGNVSTQPSGPTVIAAGTRLDGELKPNGPLQLEGIITGTVTSQADVAVGPEGTFEGTLAARTVVVRGHVRGKIICERLEIEPSGRVVGEVHSEALVIAAGGRFHGESREPGDATGDDQPPKEDQDFLRTLAV